MKTSLGTLALVAILGAMASVAHADNADLDFSCVARKADKETTTSAGKGNVEVNKEDWEYVVTLENKTFNDKKDLEIKYIVFFKQEQLGSLASARLGRQTGETKIDLIKGHDKATFNTTAVKITKSSLGAGYYYTNGAKQDASGALAGLWVRIYQDGNLIAEMSRPANLPSKEKWDK